MSADGNGRVDSRILKSRAGQLTEREWRRPLTWLDRFRDAVLLPASWGDENIQPHVGNKYLKIDFFSFFFKPTGDTDAHEQTDNVTQFNYAEHFPFAASAIKSWQKKSILESLFYRWMEEKWRNLRLCPLRLSFLQCCPAALSVEITQYSYQILYIDHTDHWLLPVGHFYKNQQPKIQHSHHFTRAVPFIYWFTFYSIINPFIQKWC